MLPRSMANPTARRSLSRTLGRLVARLFAILGFTMVLVTVTPLTSWWARKLAGRWEDPRGDVLIVLSGAPVEGGILGQSSFLRAKYAVLVYREGATKAIVVSGGGTGTAVAPAMAEVMASSGVPAGVIQVETQSRSTRENALNTRAMLQALPGTKVLLSSDYHMFRAARVFKKAGVEVLPRPVPDALKRSTGWRGRWPAFLDLVAETLKIGYYWGRGWI